LIDGMTLNKALPALILPTGLAILLCCYGIWKRKWGAVAAAAGLLAVAGCPAVSDMLLLTLEGPYQRKQQPSGAFDAVYVLGGYLDDYCGVDLEPQWDEAGDRLELGIRMVRDGRANVLVLSEGGSRRPPEGERGKVIAGSRGIPEAQIIVTREVENTADEAQRIAALARERGWSRIALATSAFHMRRALQLMEEAGVPVTPAPTDFKAMGGQRRLEHFLPSGEGLKRSERALREWMGIGFYRLKRLVD